MPARITLHDHLDGALRPSTVLELADEVGHRLPANDVEGLAHWFHRGGSEGLVGYLEAFEHTVGVMQTPEALQRVAREMIEDVAADHVIHAEVRFAPLLHLRRGMTPDAVVEAVLDGLAAGSRATGVGWGLILDAIRSDRDSLEVAELAVRRADQGVVAFDLAGPEDGFPPDDHLAGIRRVREAGLWLTLHAGEAGGVESIARAVNRCGADRLGHGFQIIDDCRVVDGEIVDFGPVASVVRDRQIPLEICPTSNTHTQGWPMDRHPLALLDRAGFVVTISPDNRLMSSTSLEREYEQLRDVFGWTETDLARVNRQAAGAAFVGLDRRRELLRMIDSET